MIEVVVIANLRQEVNLNKKEMKKLLVGLSIAGLIAGAGLSMTGCATP
jgi:radical SAM modification target selenobiotic family peptide